MDLLDGVSQTFSCVRRTLSVVVQEPKWKGSGEDFSTKFSIQCITAGCEMCLEARARVCVRVCLEACVCCHCSTFKKVCVVFLRHFTSNDPLNGNLMVESPEPGSRLHTASNKACRQESI